MTNHDDFWKSQFVKHETILSTGKPPTKPIPVKPRANPPRLQPPTALPTELPGTSRMEKILLAGSSTKSALGFEAFASLILSKVPATTRTRWEGWLFDWKDVLVERWGLTPDRNGSAVAQK